MRVGLVASGLGHFIVGLVCPHITKYALFAVCLVLRLVLGFSQGVLVIVAAGIVIRMMPEAYSPHGVGALEASRTFAFVISPLYGSGLFIGGGSSLVGPYLMLAILLCIFLVVFELLVSFASIERERISAPRAIAEQADPFALLKKPPTIGLLVALLICSTPVSTIEPGLEAYLTGTPFNLSVSQVGVVLLLIAVMDIFGATLAAPLAACLGQIPMLYLTVALTALSTFLLALGPQTWLAVQLSFVPQSLGQLPLFVLSPAIMMRVCRTYGLSPLAYLETVMAIVVGSSTVMLAVFSMTSGVLVDLIGFRSWYLVLGIMILSLAPTAIFWGFRGLKLATAANGKTDELRC